MCFDSVTQMSSALISLRSKSGHPINVHICRLIAPSAQSQHLGPSGFPSLCFPGYSWKSPVLHYITDSPLLSYLWGFLVESLDFKNKCLPSCRCFHGNTVPLLLEASFSASLHYTYIQMPPSATSCLVYMVRTLDYVPRGAYIQTRSYGNKNNFICVSLKVTNAFYSAYTHSAAKTIVNTTALGCCVSFRFWTSTDVPYVLHSVLWENISISKSFFLARFWGWLEETHIMLWFCLCSGCAHTGRSATVHLSKQSTRLPQASSSHHSQQLLVAVRFSTS
jgi:hypothetical protein